MTDQTLDAMPAQKRSSVPWRTRLAGARWFQQWAARVPGFAWVARKEGEALFDFVAGFVHSQVLQAVVELHVLDHLAEGRMTTAQLAHRTQVPEPRMGVLLQAAFAMKLVRPKGDAWVLADRGAALRTVPGLQEMIAHHSVLYRDLSDPVAFFKGGTEPELAQFWPYVFGAASATDPDISQRYSRLMADSQILVAEDTLRTVNFAKLSSLLDVGGGTGAFLRAVGAKNKHLDLHLFDLPSVVSTAGPGLTVHPGSFRDDPLPNVADMISLIRVCYDHRDETVLALMHKIYDALPAGGQFLVSEPMKGGAKPNRPGDIYFAMYCMAMETGTARSQAEIAGLMGQVGFTDITMPAPKRAFVTSVVMGKKPS